MLNFMPHARALGLVSSDGHSCIHLDQSTNLCRIYDSRPAVCRIDGIYADSGMAEFDITPEEWYSFVSGGTCKVSILTHAPDKLDSLRPVPCSLIPQEKLVQIGSLADGYIFKAQKEAEAGL